LKSFTIAIACELAPAKTLIPIIKRLKELESEKSLNWNKSKIIGLTHGTGVKELINPYCDEIYSIGEGRRAGKVKRTNISLGYLIAKDIFKAIKALRGKSVDLLITCGNAGDVRKSIIAANLLKIPIIHIEQDIYNPIEVIAFSNLITIPSEKYKDFLKEVYYIDCLKEMDYKKEIDYEKEIDYKKEIDYEKNLNKEEESYVDHVENIHGYPMASYVNEKIKDGKLIAKKEIVEKYGTNDFILVVLGGDVKNSDLKKLIEAIQKSDFPTLIVPYRFEKESIESLIKSKKVQVLDGFVDLLSLMKSANLLIYGAGMGMTIETGVLEVPSIKIAGFHKKHGSVDLARKLKIPIFEIEELSIFLSELRQYNLKNPEDINNFINNNIKKPDGKKLVENGEIAIKRVVNIINNFNLKNPPKKSGFKSIKAIWNQRSQYR